MQLVSVLIIYISLLRKNPEETADARRKYGYGYFPRPQNHGRPHLVSPPVRIPSAYASFMEALESIARNDELRCVPRLLCELTSGSGPEKLQLPFDINAESLVGLLAVAEDRSALLSLGRAALLGYVSKDAAACIGSYSSCPKDPDRLVQYLNNYNGGFFRFFSGHNVPQVQKRILTGPSKISYTQNDIQFKKGKTLKFPVTNEYLEEDLNYPKAPLDHIRLPVIFPDRTGTGEFRFDADELKDDTNTFENNNIIRQYAGSEHNFRDFNKHKYNTVFSFPLGDF